jgi:hypothetical protein
MSKWFKMLPILALVAILSLPMSAFATQSNGQYQLDVKTDVQDNHLTITAKVTGAQSAESGEWQIVPLGPNKAGKPAHAQQSTDLTFSHTWEGLEPGEYCFKVHYTGKLDGNTSNTVLHLKGKNKICATVKAPTGEEPEEEPKVEEPPAVEPKPEQPQECKFEDIDEADFHDIAVQQKENGDMIEVTATLQGAQAAKGNWYFAVGLADADQPAFEQEKEAEGTSITFSLNKNQLTKNGDYAILVVFEGNVDGNDCQAGMGWDFFGLEDGGNVTQPKEAHKKPTTPEDKEKAFKEVKGGKMPKTAVPQINFLLFGACLMTVGAGLLLFRRAVK